MLVVLVVALAAQIPVLVDLAGEGVVYENLGITDLGRDLLGVSAIEQGGMPYRQLRDLIREYGTPDLPLSGQPRLSGWVVHPPLALAADTALFLSFSALGPSSSRGAWAFWPSWYWQLPSRLSCDVGGQIEQFRTRRDSYLGSDIHGHRLDTGERYCGPGSLGSRCP